MGSPGWEPSFSSSESLENTVFFPSCLPLYLGVSLAGERQRLIAHVPAIYPVFLSPFPGCSRAGIGPKSPHCISF